MKYVFNTNNMSARHVKYGGPKTSWTCILTSYCKLMYPFRNCFFFFFWLENVMYLFFFGEKTIVDFIN